MSRVRGFTLIELMVTVAIVAILAAIAVPSYTRYAYRARRSEGQQLLQNIAMAEERFYSTNNRYGSLAEVGFNNTASPNGYYLADIPASASTSSQSFTVEAVPQGVQASDACQTLTLNAAGKKTPDPSDSASNSNGSCW